MTSQSAYAEFTRRYSAGIIDGAIIGPLAFLFDFLFSKIGYDPGWPLIWYLIFRVFIILQIPGILYSVLFLAMNNGQTMGMRFMNIQAVDLQYRPVGIGRSLFRFISNFITGIFGWISFQSMMNHPQRQTWGDRLSRTYMIVTTPAKPSMLPLFGAYIVNAIFFVFIYFLVLSSSVTLHSVSDYTRVPIWSWMAKKERFEIKLGAKEYWDAGQTYLLQADRMDPNETNYEEKHRLLAQSAREEFKHALAVDPENPRIHAALGNAFALLPSDTAKQNAYDSYVTAMQLDPENPYYVYSVGVSAFNLERYEETRDLLEKSIQMNKEYAPAYSLLGQAYQQLAQNDLARINYEKALELISKTNKSGEHDKAIEALQKALSDL